MTHWIGLVLDMFVTSLPLTAMAGNIIPAIATTNAIVAGLIVMEALKVLRGRFDQCRMVSLTLSVAGVGSLGLELWLGSTLVLCWLFIDTRGRSFVGPYFKEVFSCCFSRIKILTQNQIFVKASATSLACLSGYLNEHPQENL